jgi:hypothetical protein
VWYNRYLDEGKREVFMRKTLFFVLATLIISACTNTTGGGTDNIAPILPENPETPVHTFYRAVKIGEIDEPTLHEVSVYDEDYNYIGVVLKAVCASIPSAFSNSEEAEKHNWIIRNMNKYADDIYIGQTPPSDIDVIDGVGGPSNVDPLYSWDLIWEVRGFIPAGAEYVRWPYDPALDPMPLPADVEETFLPSYYSDYWWYTVIKANIYQWTLMTE